jgi:HSP20 family molecular chaperone IbpA
MNNDWLKDFIAHQRKMMELSKNLNSYNVMQDLIEGYMANLGINDFTREKRANAEESYVQEENAPSPNFYDESSHEAILHIFLPGIMSKEDLTITIIDELLLVTGKSKIIGDSDGSFSKLFRLPVNVAASDLNANYKSDYLIIRIPKLKNKFWKVIDVQFK